MSVNYRVMAFVLLLTVIVSSDLWEWNPGARRRVRLWHRGGKKSLLMVVDEYNSFNS